MPDSLYQLGESGPETNFPAIKTTRLNGSTVITPVWLIAGLPTYVATVINSTAAASKNHLLLHNATGSGKKVRIWDIKVNPNITAAIAGTSIVLNLLRTSDKGTVGTAQTIGMMDTNNDALPAQITATANPTLPTVVGGELASATVLIEETSGTEGRLVLFKADSVVSAIVLNEGQGLLVRQGAFAGVGAINISMYFTVD